MSRSQREPRAGRRAVLFLVSQAITLFGSSLVQFAITWYVTLGTASGVWVAALTVAAYLPQFIVSFFSGVWADRYPRKTLIIAADASIAAATLALALLFPYIGEGTPVLIALILVSVIRSVGAGVQTPAVNAAIPDLVPEEKLMRFNGANATVQSVVGFAAPAAAGAILSLGSLRATLLIDILTAAVGIGILSAIALPFVRREEKPSAFSELRAGIAYAAGNRFVGPCLILSGLFIFLCVPAGFLASLFVTRFYGGTYFYLTAVEVVGFVGMTLGGILLGVWGGFRNRMTTLLSGMTVFGALAVVMGVVVNFPVYLVMMGIYGIALTVVQTAFTTLFQENTAPEMQGRVFGLFGAMYSGFLPLGMAVFGPLADAVSLRYLMIGSGLALLLTVAFTASRRRFCRLGRKKEAQKPESV